MSEKKIKSEFGIENSYKESSAFIIEGRCYVGPIRVGDTFNFVYKAVPQKTESGFDRSQRIGHRAVNIRIDEIVAYTRKLDEIDSGLTARLTVSGEGADTLQNDDVLGKLSDET